MRRAPYSVVPASGGPRCYGAVGGAVAALAAAAGMALTAGSVLPPAAATASLRLAAREFVFAPKDAAAPPGEVTFVVKNEGAIEHNFVLEDRSKKKLAEIAVIEPGQVLEVRSTLQPGTYVIYCSLPGHRDAGMAGTLTVR